MVLLEITKPISIDLIGFIPEKIADGEYWRVITGQLLHTNLNHLYLNTAGLLLIWALHGEYYTAKHYVIVTSVSLIIIGIALGIIYQNTIYSGLSGVLHALLIYGSILDIKRKLNSGWLIFAGIWLKVLYENTFGASGSTAELISASVAVESHLIGAMVGLFIASIMLLIERKKAL